VDGTDTAVRAEQADEELAQRLKNTEALVLIRERTKLALRCSSDYRNSD